MNQNKDKKRRKALFNEQRLKDFEKYAEQGEMDSIRSNELLFIKKEVNEIVKAHQNKDIKLPTEIITLLENSLNSIAKIEGRTEQVKLTAEKQEILETQKANIIKELQESSLPQKQVNFETKVQEIMEKFPTISEKFAEKIVKNPKAAEEEAKAKFKKIMEEMKIKEEKEKAARIKKLKRGK